MKPSEVRESLVGERVSCIFTGYHTTGTITKIVEDEYSIGVKIHFDQPVRWGDDLYYSYESTARKIDGFGNLSNTYLL